MLGRMDTARVRRLQFIGRIHGRNVVGAVLAFVYFRLIDPLQSDRPVGWADVVFFVCAVAFLGVIGVSVGARLTRPLLHPDESDPQEVRRVALMLPFTMAVLS